MSESAPSPEGDSNLLFRELPSHLRFSTEEKRNLRSFVRAAAARVLNGRAFTCVISDDTELRRLNQTFLGHDYATDVLSFPLAENREDFGEIIISAERAEAQAAEFGHDRVNEIQILMLHGLLHLAGMDHERDSGEMARAERKWRQEFGLPVTLIARAHDNGKRRGKNR
jgi:probable rRNA maturation factor